MSKFKLEICIDNAVYEESLYDELCANLMVVARQVDSQQKEGVVRDTNGNKVGKFFIIFD
jgi:hypothetical protein